MDKQEIFNKVYIGLRNQDFQKSVDAQYPSLCLYRGYDDRKCAAGHIIPDELYNKEYEDKKFTYLHELHNELNLNAVTITMIGALQNIHDYSTDADGMKDRLELFAISNNLIIPD